MVHPNPEAGITMNNASYAEQYIRLPPPDAGMPDLSGFPVGCVDTGTGHPVLMLHCSGSDHRHWDRVIAAWGGLDAMPRRFLRPELFGCGQTARWPGSRPMTLLDQARLAATAIAGLDRPVDLVGHSFGGAVALKLALSMPERIRSLTLIEPAACFLLVQEGAHEDRLFSEIAGLGQAMRHGAMTGTPRARQDAMGRFVDYWNGTGKWKSLAPAARQAMADMTDVVAAEFVALLTESTRLTDCRGLAIPTLLVFGDRSPEAVRHIAQRLAAAIPGARHACIREAGHMLPLSHAAELAALILGGPAAIKQPDSSVLEL